MSGSDDYGRAGIPPGMQTTSDPLGDFIRRTVEEARVSAGARDMPGMPPGMMPMVAIDSTAPLTNPQLKYVMDAFVMKCAEEARSDSGGNAPGVPAGMQTLANLGRPPVPQTIAAAKLDAFIDRAAEFGLSFPVTMMPAAGPETVLPAPPVKPPEQKIAPPPPPPIPPPAAIEEPYAGREETVKPAAPAARNDEPELVTARPDKIKMRQVLNPALIDAARKGKPDEVRQQIRNGADVNGVNEAKETACHAAIKGNSADSFRILLLNRADPFKKDGDGVSAIELAQKKNNPDVMAVLQEPAVKQMLAITVNMTYPVANRPSLKM